MPKSPSDRYIRFYQLIIDALNELGGSATPREVKSAVIASCGLSQQELDRTLSKGVNAVENEIAWARNTLREAGILDGSERGVWKLTELGRQTRLTLEEARILRAETHARRDLERSQNKTVDTDDNLEEEVSDPEKAALLTVLQSLSPGGFERFCQRLLRESGFSEVHVSGKSGDGGIDGHGILQVNELVSFRVLFQCKRYQGSVGSEIIRNFRGAMQGRTDKGIFITTGTFTSSAEGEATRDGTPPIELVDGERLVQLLERLKLGVKPRVVYDVDHKFFEEFQ